MNRKTIAVAFALTLLLTTQALAQQAFYMANSGMVTTATPRCCSTHYTQRAMVSICWYPKRCGRRFLQATNPLMA